MEKKNIRFTMTASSFNKPFKDDDTGSNIDTKVKEYYLFKEEINKTLLFTWLANISASLYMSD